MGRDAGQVTLLDAVIISATSYATHSPVDVSDYSGKTIYVQSSGDVTIYVQGSYDGTNWHEMVDESDTSRTWNCNNEKVYFGVDDYLRYIRILVHNATAAAITVTVVMDMVV